MHRQHKGIAAVCVHAGTMTNCFSRPYKHAACTSSMQGNTAVPQVPDLPLLQQSEDKCQIGVTEVRVDGHEFGKCQKRRATQVGM